MDNIRYHEVQPSNDQASFKEFNSIDFELRAPGRKLLKNSILVSFNPVVNSTGTTAVVKPKRIGLDNKIGYHGAFESFTTSSASGMIENVQDYPRYVAMLAAGSLDESDLLNVRYQAEGRGVTLASGQYVVQQPKSSNETADLLLPMEYCVMPKIALNSMMGDDYSFDKNGSIKVSTVLARNNNFLFGLDVDGNVNYNLTNVKLHFISVPDNGKQEPMMMNTVVSAKSAINSDSANLSFKVPATSCSGVVMSFIKQDNENLDTKNSYALEKLPNIDSVQFMFNSSTSQGISYAIEDQDELIRRGLKALGDSGHSQVSASKYAVNEGYLIGEGFSDMLDLSKEKFSVQIKSQCPEITTAARLVYLYFLNIIEL